MTDVHRRFLQLLMTHGVLEEWDVRRLQKHCYRVHDREYRLPGPRMPLEPCDRGRDVGIKPRSQPSNTPHLGAQVSHTVSCPPMCFSSHLPLFTFYFLT